MNKLVSLILLIITLGFGVAHAAEEAYQLLEPSVFSITGETVTSVTATQYATKLYTVLLIVTAALAVLMLIVAGFQYILSSVPGSKEDAKKRIGAALLGLFIALVSWVILETINPDLLFLDFSLGQ